MEVRAAELALPQSTANRRINDLVRWGLLRPERRGRYVVVDATWHSLASAAIAERPDLETLLSDPSTLPILASLPDGPGPARRECAGVSRPTWRDQLAALHRAGIVLRRGRAAWLNDQLPGLGHMVEAYRGLHARWEDAWADREDARDPITWLPIHQCGTETAWRVRNGLPHDALHVPLDDAYFRPLVASFRIAYRGARDLDLLDLALLHVRAENDLPYAVAAHDAEAMDARVLGLLLAGCGEEGLSRTAVEARFDFYGLGRIHDHLVRVARSRTGPAWTFRTQYIQEFGLTEGCLV